MNILGLFAVIIGGIALFSWSLAAKGGWPLGIMAFETGFLLFILALVVWISPRRVMILLNKRWKPTLFTEKYHVYNDGHVKEYLEVNPSKTVFDEEGKETKIPEEFKGQRVEGIYHRDWDFGNPIHFFRQGGAKNINIVAENPPTENYQLQKNALKSCLHAGRDIAAALQNKEDSLWNKAIPLITLIGLAVGFVVVSGLIFGLQDTNKQILAKLGEIATQIVAIAGSRVTGA
jgi:hypothetical protein